MLKMPSQKFFIPNEKFIKFMENTPWIRYRQIIDCGAGVGHVAAKLKNNKVLSIDKFERDSTESQVLISDALDFPFTGNEIVMVCRPCHGGWHELLFNKARKNGCIDFLYIGLERNLETDFGDSWIIEKLLSNVGEDGEHLWRVFGNRKNCREIVQVGDNGWWYTTETDRVENSVGGGYTPVDSCLGERKWVATLDQLYQNPDDFSQNSKRMDDYHKKENPEEAIGKYGWCAPDGKFWPCGNEDHDTLIYNCFGLDTEQIAKNGWIKCYGKFWSSEDKYGDNHFKANWKQMKTLKECGYTKWDEDNLRDLDSLTTKEKNLVLASLSQSNET